jgi:hypothetical protein
VKLVDRPTGKITKAIEKQQQYQVAIGACASFFQQTQQNGVQGVAPFKDVVNQIIGEDLGCFKRLDRIVRVPVFAPDGSLRTEKGYHEELGCYLDPRMTFRPVPDVVTDEDVSEAHHWLFEATRDFSFSDAFDGNEELPVRDGSVDEDGFPMPNLKRGASSRTNVYAAIMQGFMRNCIDGPTPIYAIDKPTPGEGAGYLADVISYILEGGRPYVGTMGEKMEEFKKEIVATLLSSTSLAFYDNINFHIDNPILASALTAGNFRGRILGASINADVPIRLLWIIAGKNLSMSAELMRRVVPIKIDSAMPHPERDRPKEYYKTYPLTLQQWLAIHRHNLVWACHVLGRNWFQKGCPAGSTQMESFSSYASVMGGIFQAAGIGGFLENRERYLGEKAIDDDSEKNFVIEMLKRYPDQEIELRYLITDLLANPTDTTLSDLLGGNYDLGKMTDKQLSVKTGYHIRKFMSGRTYNIDGQNYKLLIVGDRRPVKYRLARV